MIKINPDVSPDNMTDSKTLWVMYLIKGIVQFEMNFWYVLAYLKGIQDDFCSSFDFDIFRSNRSCLSVI